MEGYALLGASVGVNVGVNTTLAELANAAVLSGGANGSYLAINLNKFVH